MSYEIEPSPTAAGKPTLNLKSGSAYFFSRDRPQEVQIRTPTVTGAIRGTEFNVLVGPDGCTTVTMIDGEVELTNSSGSLILNGGDQGVAEAGRAPVKTAVLNAVNVIQWNLYYPGVLDLAELDLNAGERGQLAESLAAYQRGELLEALKKYPADHQPESPADHLYLGALLLSVGLVDQTLSHLEAAASGGGNNPALANALRELIARHAHAGDGISGRVLLPAIPRKSCGGFDCGAQGGGEIAIVRICVGTGGGAGIQLRSHGRGAGRIEQEPRPCPPQSAGDCLERVSFGRAKPDWRRDATV
jgi:hypothetical protein